MTSISLESILWEVDWDFAYVLSAALALGESTDGAYDVTVSALSDVWGFGPQGPTSFPSEMAVVEALARAQVLKICSGIPPREN